MARTTGQDVSRETNSVFASASSGPPAPPPRLDSAALTEVFPVPLVARAPTLGFLTAAGSVLAVVLTLFSAFESAGPGEGPVLWGDFFTRLAIDFSSLAIVVTIVALAKWVVPSGVYHKPPSRRALFLSFAPYTVGGIAGGVFRYCVRAALGISWQVAFPWELGTNVGAGILTFTLIGFVSSQSYPLLERLERSRALIAIAEQAATIAAGRDFARRVGQAERRDDVGHLARTLNYLLETVETTFASHHTFLADTSHELRNPLLALRLNLDVLQRVADGPERDECLAAAVVQTERMARLVADLLTLARLDAGIIVESKPVALRPLLEATLHEAQSRYREHRFRFSGEGGAIVLGDEGRLRQVLDNLLDNAARHTPAGGEVTVSVETGGQQAVVVVADNGEGIPPEHLPHVFERFYCANRADGAGVGLGLAIAKHLCQAHGGDISAESTPGKGSRFVVTLPAFSSTLQH
ncbi:MAG: sensor histidine kinase [Chloroflexota bacterium]